MSEEYKPTQEEMDKAEEMMTPFQRMGSEERALITDERVDKIFAEDYKDTQPFIDDTRNGKRVCDNPEERFGLENTGKAWIYPLEKPFDGYGEFYGVYDYFDRIPEKWKQFLPEEAYNYILSKTGGYNTRIHYVGKRFQTPVGKNETGEWTYNWEEFSDIWVDIHPLDDGSSDEVSWDVYFAQRMKPEEKEMWLESLEERYKSKEFKDERKKEIKAKLLDNIFAYHIR